MKNTNTNGLSTEGSTDFNLNGDNTMINDTKTIIALDTQDVSGTCINGDERKAKASNGIDTSWLDSHELLYTPEEQAEILSINTEFLKILGYSENENVYTRAINQTGRDSKKFDGQPISELLIGKLLLKNKKGNSIYFTVNGQGHKKADITQGRAIFVEIDSDEKGNTVTLDKQYSIITKSFGGLEPTVAVFTGNKSLHCYYVFTSFVDINLWETLQKDVLAHIPLADQACKDAGRQLRLLGFSHPKTKKVSSIFKNTGVSYTYEQLRKTIPSTPYDTKNSRRLKNSTKTKTKYNQSKKSSEDKVKVTYTIDRSFVDLDLAYNDFANRVLSGKSLEIWENRKSIPCGEQNNSLYTLVCELVAGVRKGYIEENDAFELGEYFMNSLEKFDPKNPWRKNIFLICGLG